MRRKITAAALTLGLAGTAMFVTSGSAQAHGYTTSPKSRQAYCADGTVSGCGQIQWEPQSVEGPKGFPSAGPADGTICSGGNSRFSELDDPRGGTWPATHVNPGQGFTFNWTFTARHATTDFRYYITKDSYDPGQRLTRSDLELQPFMTVPYGGRQPASTEQHQGSIPSGKSGKHLILAVWNIADTGNAFYSCSDVQF